MSRDPRRKDRAISDDEARAVLDQGEYGILATVDAEGQPYAVPLSYILYDNALYVHCALKGHKVDNIEANPKVSFCVVGPTEPVCHENGFSTFYESCVVFGTARVVPDGQEKHDALYALTRKYFPEEDESVERAITRHGPATLVYAISLDRVTGKAKR